MERKEILVIALIVVVLLAVGLQTLQLSKLTTAAVVAPTVSGAAVKPISSAGSSHSAPTSLQNLPTMVGGC